MIHIVRLPRGLPGVVAVGVCAVHVPAGLVGSAQALALAVHSDG